MPSISLAPVSGRYLSFAEREEIAILKAQGCGVCQIARRVGKVFAGLAERPVVAWAEGQAGKADC